MLTAATAATASDFEKAGPPEAGPERKRCLALDAFRVRHAGPGLAGVWFLSVAGRRGLGVHRDGSIESRERAAEPSGR
jgi:hypothetical protein